MTRKQGVYEYVLIDEPAASDERLLSIRAFSESDRLSAYEAQKGCCGICGKRFDLGDMQADHIVPWSPRRPYRGRQLPHAVHRMQPEKGSPGGVVRSLRHIRRHLVGVGKRSDDVASLPVARPAASLGGAIAWSADSPASSSP